MGVCIYIYISHWITDALFHCMSTDTRACVSYWPVQWQVTAVSTEGNGRDCVPSDIHFPITIHASLLVASSALYRRAVALLAGFSAAAHSHWNDWLTEFNVHWFIQCYSIPSTLLFDFTCILILRLQDKAQNLPWVAHCIWELWFNFNINFNSGTDDRPCTWLRK